MKTLYLIDNFSLGGAQMVVKGIMENNQGNEKVFAFGLRDKPPHLPISHTQAICFPGKQKYSLAPLRFLKHFITEQGIERIHCQLPRSILFGYLLKGMLPELNYIVHEQGDVFESKLHAFLLRFYKKRADGILACSGDTAAALESRAKIDRDKLNVLYNFVDTTRFRAGKLKARPIQKIGFAGRIVERKGWREFVDLAAHFRNHPGLSFHMAGSGSEQGELEKLKTRKGLSNLQIRGFISEVQEFYRDIDLLVVPSHFEPMGMVAIEAMACGVPVLATDVPGLNEVARKGENAWTYPPGSAHALIAATEALLKLKEDEVLQIREKALLHARTFSYSNFYEQLTSFYEN
ncbi:MAG: hypothetical protein CSA96_02450 [Bacteroidetes bacterium]|nr:MAG: hypothetical protein CSA96_02450 [Bacteroidota bacterium]